MFECPYSPDPAIRSEEYLDLERSARQKHEYHRGEVFAMGDASYAHTVVVGNLAREIGQQIKDKPCRVSPTDLRVRVGESGLYTYPDIVVVCGPPRLEQPGDTLVNPAVIIEVLSEATEAYDRGRKFELYQSIPSLTDYMLVAQGTARIEHFQRQPSGHWLYTAENRLEASIAVPSIGCELSLAEVYDKVDGLREPLARYQ
jgi:Uma2 family endonuclease